MALTGLNAVVTGGGRGIGSAVARALSAAGASVLVAARSRDQVEAVADELTRAGGLAFAAVCDVTDEANVEALANEAREPLGEVDILVNNAGVAAAAPLHRTSLDEWNRLFAVNATGPFLCTRAFLPEMMGRGRGRIVTVASVAGLHGAPYIAAYTASKHAAIGLMRCAAAEAASSGVTVNAVCPGYVNTEMTRETIDRIVGRTGRTEEQALEAILEGSPQRRLIQPEEVAHAVLSLCAEEARSVNGQTIVIDGGAMLS